MFKAISISIRIYTSAFLSLILAVAFFSLSGCGASGGNETPISFRGTVLSPTGQPIVDIGVYLFETAESATSDQNGEFIIDSFRQFGSVGFFVQTSGYSNTVRIEDIPENTTLVSISLRYDEATQELSVASVNYSNSLPENPEEPVTPEPTPAGPAKSPTPKPGNFNENGDTKAFGIPQNLTGNISRGRSVWANTCSSCHSPEKSNKSYSAVSSALKRIPQMNSLRISNQQAADVVAYLNRGRK